MKIDRQLIQKYNKPVPRYTSYPPANFFSEDYSANDYLLAVKDSNSQAPDNISIYIHIPFCKKMCFYCGCNSCPMAKEDDVKAYIDALKKEINLVIPHILKTRKISQIHYGGGTPNAIPVHFLEEINQLFFTSFTFVTHPEIAIECHPAYLDELYINGLKQAGFNRFSLGFQDFNSDVLKAVNREPSLIPLNKLVDLIRKDGEYAINFDFIYGLPLQTKDSFLRSIDKAIQLKPDRLVTFSYAHVPWVNKAQNILEKKGLPTSEEKIDMTEAAFNLLEQNAYKSIGMDHYVLETDDLYKAQQSGKLHRNFQGYCTRETTGQVYAFGVSAISQLNRVYAQNTKSIPDYIASINNEIIPINKGYQINDNEHVIKEFITQFMCNKTIHWNETAKALNTSVSNLKQLLSINEEQLLEFKKDGILEIKGESMTITENGLPFIRNVVATFDPLLKNSNKTFSKSV
jgi:oxygen-independent coproporphyrinogen III oxidase